MLSDAQRRQESVGLRLKVALDGRLGTGKRNILVIAGATGVGQLLAVISAPILSRLFSPADFGLLAVVLAVALPLGSVSALRFEAAIPIAEEERAAYSLVWLSLLAMLGSALVTCCAIAVFGSSMARAMNVPRATPWLWVIPCIALLGGLILVLNQLAIRHRRYPATGRRAILQSATTVSGQLGSGAAQVGPGGLIIGYAVGQLVGALSLLRGSGMTSRLAMEGRSTSLLLASAKRYRRFPAFLAPAGLLNAVGIQLPVLLLAVNFGSADAGWFGMTQRVVALPAALIGLAVAQVYLGELARVIRDNPDRAMRMFNRSTRTLALVGVSLALVLLVFSPWAFPLVLGPEWATSGLYAQAASIGLAAQIVASPLASTLTVLEHQKTQLVCDAARVVGMIGAVTIVSRIGGSALSAVWALTAVTTLFYAAYWALSRRSLRNFLLASEVPNEEGK